MVVAGFGFAALFVWQWFHLMAGYSLGVSADGGPASVHEVTFPLWRKLAAIGLAAATLAGLGLLAMERRQAASIFWWTFGATVLVGAYDLVLYGTMGTATSLIMVGLLLIVALLTSYWKREGVLK